MDMDMDMDMGSTSSGAGVPTNYQIQRYYWEFVGAAIAAAFAANLVSWYLYINRTRQAKKKVPQPAKPKFFLWRWNATLTAIVREASHFSLPSATIKGRAVRFPTFGRVTVVVAYLVLLIVLCFYKLNTADFWSFEDIGYRTGFVSVTQIPLIFLLAGKNNIIGYLSGISYEKLNWLHRWTARCLLFTTTVHMGYWFTDWARFDYVITELKTNTLAKQGFVAWIVLIWIVISSVAPIRGWNYEVFVLQHIISFGVFIGFVYVHTPESLHGYIWLPVGLFFFDRVVRGLRMLYLNLSILHPKQRKTGEMASFWACKAILTPLPGNATKVTINQPPMRWSAGQHVFLSCHSVLPLQSHPFTISSIPSDGKMEFLIKTEGRGTRRIFRHAEKHQSPHSLPQTRTVAIEGPYGSIRPLRQFDSLVLIAGSSGVSYCLPLMRDIIHRLQSSDYGVVTRHIRFVWVVKFKDQVTWCNQSLSEIAGNAKQLMSQGFTVDISIYVTCDPSFTEERKSWLTSLSVPPATASGRGNPEVLEGQAPEETSRKAEMVKTELREVADSHSNSSSKAAASGACGPDGTCCCTVTVDDEDAISPAVCNCNCGSAALDTSVSIGVKGSSDEKGTSSRPSTTYGSSDSDMVKALPFLDSSINVLGGRPNTQIVIRKVLEQALGESGVVVCGPKGLVADVKFAVCSLSDERAVHKGTGAQGIYLHTEGFEY